MKLSPGKIKNLQALANDRGVIAAAAMDQRGSLLSSIASGKGIDKGQVTDQMMKEFKTAVSKVLTPHASAILLDPEWGLEAAKVRHKRAGLLLAYEKSGYDNTQPGRRWESVTNIGNRPTFNGAEQTVETFLLSPLDGPSPRRIELAFHWRLRDEKKFDTPESLRRQILADAARAKRFFRLLASAERNKQTV